MRRLALLLLTLASAPALGGTVVSRDVSDVSVTIYRDPNRREGEMQRDWPGGYALISETRTITIPDGMTVQGDAVAVLASQTLPPGQATANGPTLVIRGAAILGEIKVIRAPKPPGR